MINELYQLSKAMEASGIQAENWHREYKALRNVTVKAPCVRIVLSAGKVTRLETVSADMAAKLRKFGNNQGSFPAMNLAPLYRVDDEETGKRISEYIKKKGEGLQIEDVKGWRFQNNWLGKNFSQKYHRSMVKRPNELTAMLTGAAENESVRRLIEESRPFAKPEVLHRELESAALAMLERRQDIALALQVIFYMGKADEAPEKDHGILSVILDSESLEDDGMPTAGIRFTRSFNRSLLLADAAEKERSNTVETDAFGLPYAPLAEPMPTVKLAGGPELSLRTMFDDHKCQYRYHKIKNDTYPLSADMRTRTKKALFWLSREDKRDKTWIDIGNNEFLFAYLSHSQDAMPGVVDQYDRRKKTFEIKAEDFVEYIKRTKELDPEHYPKNIQIFILRKLDKARTKVIYTRNTTPDELILRSDGWRQAAKNLPTLHRVNAWTPFPLEIAQIMSRIWKLDGRILKRKKGKEAKHKTVSYHGMELLFGIPVVDSDMRFNAMVDTDMRIMVRNTHDLAVYAGKWMNMTTAEMTATPADRKIWDVKEKRADEKKRKGKKLTNKELTGLTLVFMGMLLYWRGIRKDDYVNDFPYLLGQMLKASDSLHELYCWAVRDKDIPPQLAGNSMYVLASEAPAKALAQLGQRMRPYIAWAGKNRDERIELPPKEKDGKPFNGPSAGYLLSVYNKTADQLHAVMTPQTRFNDYEKAQLFIGYLASFPKPKGRNSNSEADSGAEESQTEAGGNEHDEH